MKKRHKQRGQITFQTDTPRYTKVGEETAEVERTDPRCKKEASKVEKETQQVRKNGRKRQRHGKRERALPQGRKLELGRKR